MPNKIKSFGDYKSEAHTWITLATGEYYPDILKHACELYGPILIKFGQLLKSSESSFRLFRQIAEVPGWMRVQLARVFKKYVSPAKPVGSRKFLPDWNLRSQHQFCILRTVIGYSVISADHFASVNGLPHPVHSQLRSLNMGLLMNFQFQSARCSQRS